ncbi:aminopeptidase P family protein [Pseudahrensia aquimaris]|uniref:Aminopeptidase P family protein n=1 Tax=Pseudahrensia aquimaris TaxID=744461 RepID=A0ABW3FCP2_9HYPH
MTKSAFQDFSAPAAPVRGDSRLVSLRTHMKKVGVDAVLVPHADEQRNEYLPACAERLAWLTGFTGSAGAAIVTQDKAVLFVDGRYTLQAADQTDADHIEIDDLVGNPPHKWLKQQGTKGIVFGIDPWVMTENEVKSLRAAVASLDGELRLLDTNPVDAVWKDRPAPPMAGAHLHDFQYAGKTTDQKMPEIEQALEDAGADMALLTDATSVSWLFNIRGHDVAHTPLVLAHALIIKGQYPHVFIAPEKMDIECKAFLTQSAELADPVALKPTLAARAKGKKVLLDPNLTPYGFFNLVEEAGGEIIRAPDPCRLPRAIKNEAEIEGTRTAHLRDGVAITTFLAWLDNQNPGSVDEITAAQYLEKTRRAMAGNKPLQDISFDTISGSGPNGAIVHYRVTEATNRTLGDGELYLVDSGGQYQDGTTDITRTVAIGQPPRDARHAFTLVLKGHINLSLARFPKGTRGVDLDVLARNALWRHGMDYAHGTGHGVGSYLSVHEGPQNISKRGMQELLPGMIISNEPGVYKTGAFGIRIENLVLVREAEEIDGGDTPMLGFETLTLAPIDARLIDPTMMNDDELHWLNAYHGWVRRQLTPLVSEEVAQWLKQATEPLARNLPPASA